MSERVFIYEQKSACFSYRQHSANRVMVVAFEFSLSCPRIALGSALVFRKHIGLPARDLKESGGDLSLQERLHLSLSPLGIFLALFIRQATFSFFK